MLIQRFIRATAVAALLLASAGFVAAQGTSLPEAAQEALEEGRAAMHQALETYDAQYPDRSLWQEAFRHGRRARSLAPDHPEPLRFLAIAYSHSNWYGPAWNAWLEYLDAGNLLDAEATPLFSEVGSRQGYNYYQQGRLEDAADVYRRVIDEVPFDLEAHTWLGRLLLEMGRPEQAISYWRTVVERNPGDQRAAYFLELARDQAEWGKDAVIAFREGVQFYEQGLLERAQERFARATSLNEDYAEAWAWLGRVAFDRGDFEDAATFYGRATRLSPSNQTYSYFHEESRRRTEASREGAADDAVPAPDEPRDDASSARDDAGEEGTSERSPANGNRSAPNRP